VSPIVRCFQVNKHSLLDHGAQIIYTSIEKQTRFVSLHAEQMGSVCGIILISRPVTSFGTPGVAKSVLRRA